MSTNWASCSCQSFLTILTRRRPIQQQLLALYVRPRAVTTWKTFVLIRRNAGSFGESRCPRRGLRQTTAIFSYWPALRIHLIERHLPRRTVHRNCLLEDAESVLSLLAHLPRCSLQPSTQCTAPFGEIDGNPQSRDEVVRSTSKPIYKHADTAGESGGRSGRTAMHRLILW